MESSLFEASHGAKRRRRQDARTAISLRSKINKFLRLPLLLQITLITYLLTCRPSSAQVETELNPTSEAPLESHQFSVVTPTEPSMDEQAPEKTNLMDEHTTTGNPILSSASPFDRLASGADETPGGLNSSDLDYILANMAPTGAPEGSSVGEASSPPSSTINGHQLVSGTEDLASLTGEPTSSTPLSSQSADEPVGQAKPEKASSSGGISEAPTAETLSAQLIRNRKSSEQSSKVNETAPVNATLAKTPAPSDSAIMPTVSNIDYDDFDLDYQLKMNSSSSADVDNNPNLNKRDNKAPDWSALIRMPHVFSSNSTGANFLHQTPPILPSLLTVKSTQLTKQELNKVRPHFMLHYQDEGPSNPSDVNLAFANGDLLATASAGGVPLAPMMLVNNTLADRENRKPADTYVSLHNGSPVNTHSNASLMPATSESPTITTISVDNLAPTELPPVDSKPAAGNGTVAAKSPGLSQANQWYNYPHPNLHHNPLLLHHILNKPLVYAQHLNANPPVGTVSTSTSAPASSTFAPPAVVSSTGPPPLLLANPLNIIEKPTLADSLSNQPAPINRTQLQMQLNEMRALAKASGAIKQQSIPQQVSINQVTSPQQANPFMPNLGWQKHASANSPDYLSHLIGAKTRPNPMLYSGQPLRPSFPHEAGPLQPQHRIHTPHQPFTPAVGGGRLPGTNMMHHLFGNNLSGALYNNPLAFSVPPPQLPGRPLGHAPFPAHLINRPRQQLLPTAQNHFAKHLSPFGAHQHLFNQPQVGGAGSKLLASPSLLQEVYARPNSGFIASRPSASVTPCPSQSPGILEQLSGSHTSSRAAPGPDMSRSSSSLRPTSISDEDMSTYVAQLASLSAQVAQPGNWSDPSEGLGSDLPAWLLASQSANGSLPLPLHIESSIHDSQLLQSPAQKLLNSTGQNDLELLVQKLMETLAQRSSQTLQTQQAPSVLPAPQQAPVDELLKDAKLISLPDEVQSQIYQDLSPLLNPASLRQTGPPYSTLMSSQESASNKLPVYRMPENWRKPVQGSKGTPAASDSTNYYSIDGHQKKQKKDREQQNQALQIQQQRQKQVAFIEALRSSVMRMHAPHFKAEFDGGSLNGSDLATANAEFNATSVNLSSLKSNDDLFDEQSNKPIPDWLERQIIQESLVHESTRVSPFGGSSKSTYLGRGHPPPMMFGGQSAASNGGAITVRPAGPASLHPSQHAPKKLYPLHPMHPLHPARGHYPPLGPPTSMYGPMMPLQRLQPMLEAASQPNPMMHPSGNLYPMIMNPAKLLADRFPYTSAPAYLLKLPTLTGGTITAAGSLSPPSKMLLRQRPGGPFRLLNAAVTMAPPRGLKLMSSMMQSAPSIAHALHQSPPAAHQYHYQPAPPLSQFHPLMSAPSSPRFQLSEALRAMPLPPAPLVPYGPQPYQPDFATAQYQPPRPLVDSQSVAGSSELGTSAQTNGSPTTLNLKPVASTNEGVTSLAGPTAAMTSGAPGGNQLLVQPNSYSPQQQQPQQQTGDLLYQPNLSAGSPQQSAANALSRLQQATASLVELTSLASLVEEMVGGSEVESSPAAALANAINSISAAQNAALNAQASNGVSSSAGLNGSGTPLHLDHQPQVAPFSWKSLLNPILWRDKTMAKANTLERLVAAHRPPSSRLKVKYIRVPVAIYESGSGTGSLEGGQLTWDPNRQQLVTKTQLAELVGATTGSQADAHPATSPVALSQPAAAVSSSSVSSQPVATSTGGLSPPPTQLGTSASPSSAASSGDYLFDELTLDSVPKIALAMAQPELENGPIARVKYMPVIAAPAPLLKPHPMMRKVPVMGDMNPLESALYYSLFDAPSNANVMASTPEAKLVKSSSEGGKKYRKKKGKKSSDDDEDSEEDDDDDDVLTSNDLPLIESIISTIIQPPPSSYPQPMQNPFTGDSETSTWHRSRPFGSLRPEASTSIETYMHPFSSTATSHHLKPFSNKHHSHRFSLGEVVGALGARRLITSLLNKRKTSRTTSKREATSVQSLQQQHLKPEKNRNKLAIKTYGKTRNHADQQAASRRSTPDSVATVDTPTTPTSTYGFPTFTAYGVSPQVRRANSTTSGRPKIAPNTMAPVIADEQYKSLGNDTSGADRKKAGVPAADLVQYNFFLKSSHKPSPRLNEAKAEGSGEKEKRKKANYERNEKTKDTMPLYHVVADHYSKIHSGPNLASKSAIEARKPS